MKKTPKKVSKTPRRKATAAAPLSNMIQEAELLMGLPRLKDSVDKDELPINFILKRGRDRAEAAAGRQPQTGARHLKKNNK
jgi:hypothetical protein